MPSFLTRIADRALRLPELSGFNVADFDSVRAAKRERIIYNYKTILSHPYRKYCAPTLL